MSTVVPTVGDRKIYAVENDDLFIKIDDASIDLMEEEYVNKVPLSFATPEIDGKEYIIAVVDLPDGTPVYDLPVKYKNFPVLIDYGAASSASIRMKSVIRVTQKKTADENYYLMKIWKKKIISKIQIYHYMRNIKDY